MENAFQSGMEPFENPDLLPLNEIKLKVKTCGVVESVNALNKKWAEDRYFLSYEAPKIYNEDGSEIMGAKEYWEEVVTYIIEDVKWLLGLPFYRFWSNIVFNTTILDALVSFLQEAPPFYTFENFPGSPDMLDLLETLRHRVLLVFARLVTNKESPKEYMEPPFLGRLLYENYIFTIPIIFDLCQLYGRENGKAVEKILDCLFKLEPSYNDDLKKSVACLIQAFENVEAKFQDRPIMQNNEVVSLLKATDSRDTTLFQLEDMVLYVLDISSTVTVLLKNLPSVTHIFHRKDFVNKIVSVYEYTIPEMYKRLDELAYNDEGMPKYIEIKHRLDVTRIELLNLYRMIIHEPIQNAQDNYNTFSEANIRKIVDEYIGFLDNAIAEKEFITDYNHFYPVHSDLTTLQNLYPEIDAMKCDYMLQSMYVIIGEAKASTSNAFAYEAVAGPSQVQNSEEKEQPVASCSNNTASNSENVTSEKDSDKLELQISYIKDIFPHVGEGYIMECLKHYNYDDEAMINALLENKLPDKLACLDISLPRIPPDPMEASAAVDAALGVQRLNVFDNDEFDIMTRDSIDMSRVYLGKKREKYKNINEMLNDKSEIRKVGNIYNKYNLIVDDYNDEYDDTYDSHDVLGTTQDDSVEVDSRPFTTPRILLGNQKANTSSEEDSAEEEDSTETDQNGRNQFVQNPAEVRERNEQRRQAARGGKSSVNVIGTWYSSVEEECISEFDNRWGEAPLLTVHSEFNIILQWCFCVSDSTRCSTPGKPKGHGQDKDVAVNRDHKNTNKATRANHNRRSGAQWKRRQGMVPS